MMKKKVLIASIIAGVIVAITIITSVYGKNPIYNYVKNKYFPDVLTLDEQFGVKNYKTGNQTIEVDGYTMVMDQYYLKADNTEVYLRIKVTNPKLDMRELETQGYYEQILLILERTIYDISFQRMLKMINLRKALQQQQATKTSG